MYHSCQCHALAEVSPEEYGRMKAALMDQYKERNALKTILEAKVMPLADELLRQAPENKQLAALERLVTATVSAMAKASQR